MPAYACITNFTPASPHASHPHTPRPAGGKRERPPPERTLPSRNARSKANEAMAEQAGAGSRPASPEDGSGGPGTLQGLQQAALEACAEVLAELGQAALAAKAAAPAGGWKKWQQRAEALAEADVDDCWREAVEVGAALLRVLPSAGCLALAVGYVISKVDACAISKTSVHTCQHHLSTLDHTMHPVCKLRTHLVYSL
jgi:hypothetical protein